PIALLDTAVSYSMESRAYALPRIGHRGIAGWSDSVSYEPLHSATSVLPHSCLPACPEVVASESLILNRQQPAPLSLLSEPDRVCTLSVRRRNRKGSPRTSY